MPIMHTITILIKCVAIWIFISGTLMVQTGGNTQKSQSNQDDGQRSNCSNCTTHRVEVKFTTKIIQNEYIVAFDGYYKAAARENYLSSALNGLNVR